MHMTASIGGVLVANNMIYAPNADYNLYALDLKGQLQWTFAADQSIWGAPVSDGTNVYFGTLGTESVRRRCQNRQTGLDAGFGRSRAGFPGARERE